MATNVPVTMEVSAKGVSATTAALNQVSASVSRMEKAQAANVAVGQIAANVISKITASAKSFVSESLKTADSISKNARATGMSAESYQKLNYAAQQSGIGMEQTVKAVQTMQKQMYAGSAAFQKLGLNMDQVGKMTSAQQFEAVGAAVAKIQDPAARSAIALQLFGREGGRVVDMAGSFGELSAEAERMGLIMDSGALKTVEKFNDLMSTMKLKIMAVFVNAIPQIKLFAETWWAEIKNIWEITKTVFKYISELVVLPVKNIMILAKGGSLNDTIGIQDVLAKAVDRVSGSLEARRTALENATKNYTETLTNTTEDLKGTGMTSKSPQAKADRARGVSAALFGSQEAAAAIARFRGDQGKSVEKQQLDVLGRIARGVEGLANNGQEEFVIA